jgi:predicted GTPase
MADVVVINKVNAAPAADVERLAGAVQAIRPGVPIVLAASPVRLDDPSRVAGKRVLVVEDGPTLTHGGMPHGAGYMAARAAGAAVIVDPRPFAAPVIREVFERYPHIGPVLPAVGYDAAQLKGLVRTIDSSDADVVVSASPLDLAALIRTKKTIVRARYAHADAGEPTLGTIVDEYLERLAVRPANRAG